MDAMVEALKPIIIFAMVLWGIETVVTMLIKDPLIINFIRTLPTFIRTCADECGNPIP